MPNYADKYGGTVINFAINLKQGFTIDFEAIDDAPKIFVQGGKDEFYKGFFDYFDVPYSKVFILETYDAVIESGIGSSAAAAVCLVGAINAYKGLGMSREEIAETAWDIEVNKLGLYGGRQDQYVSALGGFNAMEFSKGKIEVLPLLPSVAESIVPSIVLFHTGRNRTSPKIQEGFKELSVGQVEALGRIKAITKEAIKPIIKGDLEAIGKLLDKSWLQKKMSNKGVANSKINEIYDLGKKNGAYGGKVCGAGGGGFMFFLVDPSKRKDFIESMKDLQHWDFTTDWNGLQVRVLPE